MKPYDRIKSTFTPAYLQAISRYIIDCYKARKFSALNRLFTRVYPSYADGNGKRKSPKEQFFALIKLFHPDRLKNHLSELEKAIKQNLTDTLAFYKRIGAITINQPDKKIIKEAFSPAETFRYEEAELRPEHFSEGASPGEMDFNQDIISIITTLFLGNSAGRLLEPVDLAQIDEELILGSRDIYDLDGLQYCVNVTRLDLSHNHIDTIYELQFLTNLEELDVSHNNLTSIDALENLTHLETLYLENNMLEDISALDNLENLAFVNITGNPLTGMDTIYTLQQKGVVVLYF
jgi:hypothetical protein